MNLLVPRSTRKPDWFAKYIDYYLRERLRPNAWLKVELNRWDYPTDGFVPAAAFAREAPAFGGFEVPPLAIGQCGRRGPHEILVAFNVPAATLGRALSSRSAAPRSRFFADHLPGSAISAGPIMALDEWRVDVLDWVASGRPSTFTTDSRFEPPRMPATQSGDGWHWGEERSRPPREGIATAVDGKLDWPVAAYEVPQRRPRVRNRRLVEGTADDWTLTWNVAGTDGAAKKSPSRP